MAPEVVSGERLTSRRRSALGAALLAGVVATIAVVDAAARNED